MTEPTLEQQAMARTCSCEGARRAHWIYCPSCGGEFAAAPEAERVSSKSNHFDEHGWCLVCCEQWDLPGHDHTSCNIVADVLSKEEVSAIRNYHEVELEKSRKMKKQITKLSKEVKALALKTAIDNLSTDMHSTSSRPCSTCKAMSDAIGKPFGCVTRQKKTT